ncbi:Peroxisomal membrane protein PAS20 [Basidiobolus ranarum]|uniref:Peroxisomal membrane protein PEX13 n=1 Tax=Basidiobolus ranarum TaxID=34480 RepID=A0ABR2VTS4_9FUNG
MSSPPKPWEKATQMSGTAPITNASPTLNPPAVPERSSNAGYMTTGYGGMGVNPSGYSSGYGNNYGTGYSSYGSRYGGGYGTNGGLISGYGGYGASGYNGGYGGYGGYNSGYGGYGSRYGGGYGGMGMGPNGQEGGLSLLNTVESTVQPTFQAIDSIVNAFGGFAHMLESTFMATHSSFMAMVGVIDQFGRLKTHLGQILSVFSLVRAIRNLLYRITGKKPPVNLSELDVSDFNGFQQKTSSKRPIIIFLLVVLGIPFLMNRLIMSIAKRQQAKGVLPAGATSEKSSSLPQDVEFARAMYDFNGDNTVELNLKRGDVIAILSKVDSNGQTSDWWRGRLRSGQIGIFPSNYVEILEKKSSVNSPPAPAPVPISISNQS